MPGHQQASHSKRRQRSRHVHTDSTAEYDDVASRSTVDDTTPQTSSENASMSEIPFDARFKTFVKQKKNKDQTNTNGVVTNSTPLTTIDRYDKQLPPEPVDSDDTENGPTAKLLSEYDSEGLPASTNGATSVGDSANLGEAQSNGKSFGGNRLSAGSSVNGSRANNSVRQNGASSSENNTTNCEQQNGDGDYDICEANNSGGNNNVSSNNNNNSNNTNDHDDTRPVGRRKHNPNDNEDESDDSADEEEEDEDAEEGVYDLGTSNLFLD